MHAGFLGDLDLGGGYRIQVCSLKWLASWSPEQVATLLRATMPACWAVHRIRIIMGRLNISGGR